MNVDIPSPEPLTHLFLNRCRVAGDQTITYSKRNGEWEGTTWKQSKLRVAETAMGLLHLGVEAGTPVGILSQTRSEWTQVDLANLFIGAVTVGIYPTLTGPQVRELLELSGARVVVVETRGDRVRVREATADFSEPVQIITLEENPEAPHDGLLTLQELRRLGARRRQENPEEFERRAAERKTTDVVSYIYTSGTTGEPKGALLTHANFHYVIHATNQLIPYDGAKALVFLPLAHSLQRYASYLSLITDVSGYYAESLDKVQDNLREVRPTCFALVPRVLEKIHAKAMAMGMADDGLKRDVFTRSMGVLERVGDARRSGGVPSFGDRIKHELADRLVGTRVRGGLGGKVQFVGSGGAPLGRRTHEFFENMGIPVLEGYGLTETSAPASMNTLQQRRIGSVGRPLPGTEIKIASDGEILIKGPGVFQGYYQNKAASKEAFDDAGWFKTGDIGAMSRDGFLSITDRKKDIIVTAGGKNVAPLPLESALGRHPWFSQVVVVGDRKPYLSALIGFDDAERGRLAEQHGLPPDASSEDVAAVPEVRASIEAHVEAVNSDRPSFEQVKKFAVLPEELSIETSTLTPTLKVKRRTVESRFDNQIRGLYEP